MINIPFLKLKVDIDLDKLKYESKLISDKYGYNNYNSKIYKGFKNYWAGRKYEKSWSGISLYSSDGSLYNDMTEGPVWGVQPTELQSIAPYMFSVLDKIYKGSPKSRIRLLRIAPKSSLLWHSHVLESISKTNKNHSQQYTTLTIQIPINLPKGFKYCVVDKDEFKQWKLFKKYFYKPQWFKTLREGKFEEGNAYYFNSYHYHNVYNPSDQYRTSLMFYIDMNYNDIKKLINKSLKDTNYLLNSNKLQ